MKTIYISLDNLDSSLPKLWETCEDENAWFKANPYTNEITIYRYNQDGEETIVGVIKVINVTGSYDIKDELFS